MGILTLLTALLQAATAALQVYALTYADRTQDEIDALQAEHDRLRDLGDPRSQRAADRLLARLARKRGLAAALPAAGPAPGSGAADRDSGRPARPGGG